MTVSDKMSDKLVRAELRRIKAAHPDLAEEPDAARVMERLASLRVKFRELDSAIRAAGGAKEETAGMVGELRQLSRACSSLEAQLARAQLDVPKPDPGAPLRELMRQRNMARIEQQWAEYRARRAAEQPAIEHKPPTVAELIERGDE